MATSHTEVYSDEIINIKCCLCAEKNRTREGDKYCMECKNYYCTPCTDLHNQFPSMKGHKLLDKQDFYSLGPDGSLPSFVTQRCLLHPSKVMDMFCKDHDEVACASCIALNHRSCTNIHSIPEDVDDLYNRTELNNMKQKVSMMKKTMQDMKAAMEKSIKELKEKFDKELESVKTFKQELQTLLDNTEQETIKELKKEFDKIESSLTTQINGISNLIDEINKVSSQLQKMEGNKAQEFVCIKTSNKVTVRVEQVVREQKRKTEETVVFTADQNIKAFLLKLTMLGKISKSNRSTSYQKDSLYKLKHRREIDVKLANDTSTCNIEGSCFTEDGLLLLTDTGNNKLKQLDMSTETIQDSLDLPAKATAVCVVNKKEAAVALGNKTVQFVSLENKLTATRIITFNDRCYSLAHYNGKLFISNCTNILYICDMNGKELQKISTDISGKEIFISNKHITVSASGVFLADNFKFMVILDHEGKHRSTLTDPIVDGSHGVCTDGKNVFVSGYCSNNIVQIGQDYKLLGELVKVTEPRSLSFDHHNTRLIVTHKNNTITVLELE